jgi:glycerol kinase
VTQGAASGMPDHYLALDQGGHASRALLFSRRGAVVASASEPISTRRNDLGHVEHDPEELVSSLQRSINAVCTAGIRVRSAGLATQRSSMVCWHRHSGQALSPVISWQDRRNADWLQGLAVHAPEIRELTGLVLTPHYGASKMRWCLDKLPAVQTAAAAGDLVMGPLASFLVCRLVAGRPLLADPANASRTQLWALESRDWSPRLLALFGIDAAALPRAVTSRFAYGNLATPAGPVPLTVVTGDQSAVPFAFGKLDPATAYLNLGTGAFAQRAVTGTLPRAPRLLVSVVWSEATRVDYLLEGTVNGAGSALDWLARREGIPLDDLLSAADRARAAGETPPLFINGVSGLGAPFWVSDLESRFVGSGSTGARGLAVLESIAFLLQANLEELQDHGPPFARLLVTGGLSANDYLCRCLGSLSHLPVDRADDPEATARGLARLVAAGGAGNWPPARADRQDPVANPGLSARYRRWRAALDEAIGATGG